MSPSLPIGNSLNVALTDAKPLCDFQQGQPARSQFADSSDFLFRKFGEVIISANPSCAMTQCVRVVILARGPAKIARTVIATITIPVSYFVRFRGARSIERLTYHNMSCCHSTGVQTDDMVPGLRVETQNNPVLKPPSAVGGGDPSIHRTYAPKARRLIAWVARHWTPLFRLGYRMFSHIALLQRVGQGLTTGWRLSSVPQCNGWASLSQAARV
jgi:hypothetical protein